MKTSPQESGIEQLLRTYFRRELPSRWPDAPAAEATTSISQQQTMASSRFLIGVSLVAILALYLGLASFFPRVQPSGLNPTGQVIMQRPAPK